MAETTKTIAILTVFVIIAIKCRLIVSESMSIPSPCYDNCLNPTRGVCCCDDPRGVVRCILRPGQNPLRNVPVYLPAHTTRLVINGHQISRLFENVFNGLTNLEFLDLRNNSIRTVDPKAFNTLNKLRNLSISDNEFEKFEADWFRYNAELMELYLRGNPVVCDCDVQAFMNWAKSRPRPLIIDGADCTNIQRQNILDLDLRGCTPTQFPTMTTKNIQQSCYSCSDVRNDTYCRIGRSFYCNTDQLGCRNVLTVKADGDWSISSGCYNYDSCQIESADDASSCRNINFTAITNSTTCNYCCNTQRCNKNSLMKAIASEHQITARFHRTTLRCPDIKQRIGNILEQMNKEIGKEPGVNSVLHAGWICLSYVPTYFKFYLTRLKFISNSELRENHKQFLMRKVIDGTFSSFTTPDMAPFITVENTGTCLEIEVLTAKGKLVFGNTTSGEQAAVPCPRPRFYNAVATRNCTSADDGGVQWVTEINDENCRYISDKTDQLEKLSQTDISDGNFKDFLTKLDSITVDTASFSSDDVTFTSDSIDNVLTVGTAFSDDNQNETTQKIINIVSQMLDTSVTTLRDSESASKRMIGQIEKLSEKLDLTRTKTVKAVKDNLAFLTANTSSIRGKSVTFGSALDDSGNEVTLMNGDKHQFLYSIKIPQDLLSRFNYPSATFVIYNKDTFFQAMRDSSDFRFNYTVNSRPLSINLEGVSMRDSSIPIEITFKHLNKTDKPMKCVFWDFDLNGNRGGWSVEGLTLIKSELDRTICRSNHMTNFALLMDVYGSTSKLSDIHQKALGIISMIGCIISIATLTVTLLTYILFQKLRKSNPSKVLINLCASLLFLNLCFVIGSLATSNSDNLPGCKTAAVFIHYFLLSSFAWMLIESFYMYMALIKVLNTYISRFMLKAMLFGWGFPLPILIITLAVYGSDNYGPQGPGKFCWIERNAFYGAVVAPIAAILIANSIVFALVARRLQQMGNNPVVKNQTQKNKTSKNLRGALAIFILLGLAWLLAFLAIGDAAVGFSYAFAIVNTLQGFAIFLFYVVLKKDASQAWRYKLHDCFPCIPAPKYFKSSTKGTTMTSQMSSKSNSSYKTHSTRTDPKKATNGSVKKNPHSAVETLESVVSPTVELPCIVDPTVGDQPIGTPSTYFLNRWRDCELKRNPDIDAGQTNQTVLTDQ
ncbi:adhesion G-protein coupled receptor G4-like [Tubulanus polymorphus]|uniref:adhesion G-protein coupled receptor G4-like n=1 Tax=Tubulanus polymorphus TaxID=672921 RepID=UPI003DA494EC